MLEKSINHQVLVEAAHANKSQYGSVHQYEHIRVILMLEKVINFQVLHTNKCTCE
jgi:hypothetical protein